MKKVSIREFQLNAGKYLKELPLTLTRYNLPVAILQSVDTSVDTPEIIGENLEKTKSTKSSGGKKIYTPKSVEPKIKPALCKHGYAYGLCKFGCVE